jgi:hypothetical protein
VIGTRPATDFYPAFTVRLRFLAYFLPGVGFIMVRLAEVTAWRALKRLFREPGLGANVKRWTD